LELPATQNAAVRFEPAGLEASRSTMTDSYTIRPLQTGRVGAGAGTDPKGRAGGDGVGTGTGATTTGGLGTGAKGGTGGSGGGVGMMTRIVMA